MPTTRFEYGPVGNPVMKYMVHVKGTWPDNLTEAQRAAWNKATAALGELAEAMGAFEEPDGG